MGPEDWNNYNVKLLTGFNFESELKDRDDVVVATMDATKNELSHTIVRSFPTIRLYKKGRSSPFSEWTEYNGERTMKGIKKFLDTDGVYGEAAPDDPTGTKRKDEL